MSENSGTPDQTPDGVPPAETPGVEFNPQSPQPPAYGEPPGYGQPPYYGQPPAYGQPPQPPYPQQPYPQQPYSQQPYQQQPGYPVYQQPYAAYAAPNHPKATTALVLGLVGLVGGLTCVLPVLTSPFAWATGVKARRDIRQSNGQLGGDGMATAGMVLGIIGTVLLVLLVIGIVVIVIVAINDPSAFDDTSNV